MIHLKRDVVVKTFVISGTVAVGEKRPEFLAVAQLAQDLGGTLDAGMIHRELFGNLPQQVGKLVLGRCEALGLLEPHKEYRGLFTLSDNGRLALQKGEILVPQKGEWKIWYADDSLLDESILHIERMPTEKNHGKQQHQQREQNARSPIALEKLRCISSVSDGRLYKFEQLSKEGQNDQSEKIKLEMIWSAGETEPVIRLYGELHGKKIDHSLPEQPIRLTGWSYNKLWRHLVMASDQGANCTEEYLCEWAEHSKKNILYVSFEKISPDERTKMCTSLAISNPDLKEIGRFDKTILGDVPLTPQYEDDAEKWVAWLQWEQLHDYQTPTDIKQAGKILKSKFYQAVCPPDAKDLLKVAQEKSSDTKSRFILAPYDLGLWR